MSDSLQLHGLQHARLPCPLPSPGACSNSYPLNWWCHSTISSSVAPFSSCPQSFLASEYFPMSQLFPSGGQSAGASASASVLPVNIQGWFPLRMTGLISLLFKGLSRVFSSITVRKNQFFGTHPSLWSNSHIYTWLHSFGFMNFVDKLMSLLFNMLSRFAIVFLSRSKCLLISWLQFTVRSDFGAQENKVCHCFHFLPLYLPWSDGTKCHDLSFFHVEFQASFFALLFQPHQDSL